MATFTRSTAPISGVPAAVVIAVHRFLYPLHVHSRVAPLRYRTSQFASPLGSLCFLCRPCGILPVLSGRAAFTRSASMSEIRRNETLLSDASQMGLSLKAIGEPLPLSERDGCCACGKREFDLRQRIVTPCPSHQGFDKRRRSPFEGEYPLACACLAGRHHRASRTPDQCNGVRRNRGSRRPGWTAIVPYT